MKVKKRDGVFIEIDSKLIQEAIFKAISKQSQKEIKTNREIDDLAKKILCAVLEDQDIVIDNEVKKTLKNKLVKFLKGKLFRNYMLMMNKIYYLKSKVLNKENWYKILKFISKIAGQVIVMEIVKEIIEFIKLIAKNRRESYELPFLMPRIKC